MSSVRIVIEPGSSQKYYWREIWQYKSLLFFLAWRDLAVRYKQTVIGFLWALLRPAITIAVAAFINWLNHRSQTDGVPVLVMSSIATIPWMLFSSVFGESSNSLISNSNLLTKVYFPRLIVPLSVILVCLVDFAISLLILIVVMLFYKVVPGWEISLLPLFILFALSTASGAGFWMASLNVKYRDFRYIIPVVTQFGLFISPVLFSSSDIYQSHYPEWLKYLWSMNPMVVVIEGFKVSLLGLSKFSFHYGFILSLANGLLLLFFGIWYFRKTERGFADII
ncbi:MAG: ABC transporter permease [Bacteroidota bacterium]|jgi:lipopolysaccharide transport system permease protein